MSARILVIGDSCLDVFVYCLVNRLAPDRPVPVLEEKERQTNPGMAANVYENLKRLTPNCQLKTNANWKTLKKSRYVDAKSNHMFLRVDTGKKINPLNYKKISLDADTIILSDYDKGYLTKEAISYICNNHPQVFLDTKKVLGDWANNAKYIKINNYEYSRSKKFIEETLSTKVIQTLGGDGCSYNKEHFALSKKVDVIDVSGAGDTFMASLAYKYTVSKSITTAIRYANNKACFVVQRKGVTTID